MVKELKQREVFFLQKVIIYLFIYLFSFATQRNNKNGRKERKKKRKILKDYLEIIHYTL